MEPADERREHAALQGRRLGLHITPQWSPPTSGGSTDEDDDGDRRRDLAAMEPADERREHSSQNLSRLTCPNPTSRERSLKHDPAVCAMDLSRCTKYLLTCMRALPGFRVTT